MSTKYREFSQLEGSLYDPYSEKDSGPPPKPVSLPSGLPKPRIMPGMPPPRRPRGYQVI